MLRFVMPFLALIVLLPGSSLAKRAAPLRVEPVIQRGIRYTAPNTDGRRGYVEAHEVSNNKKLWELTVFRNQIDPNLEEDVQWVFIKSLRLQDGALIVTTERGRAYSVDLESKAVKPLEARPPK